MSRSLPVLLAVLILAGCGSDDGSNQGATDGSEKAAAPAATTAAPAAPAVTGPISKNLKEEPKIPKPSGDPPTKLVVKDIVTGKGPKAKSGDTLSVQYEGVAFSTGKKFDASWDRGAQPFQFPVGGGQVIRGWDEGIPGMRVGGRRELIIPPGLAYGEQGSPPSIGSNEALIFVVDLVKIG